MQVVSAGRLFVSLCNWERRWGPVQPIPSVKPATRRRVRDSPAGWSRPDGWSLRDHVRQRGIRVRRVVTAGALIRGQELPGPPDVETMWS